MPKYRIKFGVEWPGGYSQDESIIEADNLEDALREAEEQAAIISDNHCPSWAQAEEEK